MDWELLERSNIMYATSGWRSTVYVWVNGGKREYKQKQYLLWKLRDLLEIINGCEIITIENLLSFTEAFDYEVSFHQMYNFLKMHKDVTYKSDITLFLFMWSLRKRFILSERNKFKYEVKWYYHRLLTIWLKGTHAIRVKRVTCLETARDV